VQVTAQQRTKPLSPLAALGKQLFFDPSLSASGHLACATCHSAEHAYGPPDGRAVQMGGANLERQGGRAVPSLRYVLNRTPIWTDDRTASAAERLQEGSEPPTGGYGWDGRFDSLHQQAAFPLLAENEMANASVAALVGRVRKANYADALRQIVGNETFADSGRLFAQILLAIERFELEDPSFHPYSSKFDDYLDGRATLTAAERHGLALFDDLKRGNCASCHLDRLGADGSHPLFTDYQMEALGVPRNEEILANHEPRYFDMGLCGPLRSDQVKKLEYCGLFKTPTLRNVATRRVFFHNGRFHTLRQALRFYVRRDTDPQLWYTDNPGDKPGGFDDLPPKLSSNIDHIDEPLTRHPGEAPVWSDDEIEDVIAFLKTLTDRDASDATP
jgi:cytochrome c peroxidase